MIKRYLFLLFSLLFFSALFADDANLNCKSSCVKFMENYYLSPEPDKITDFLRGVSANYDDELRSAFSGFCYEVFRANPDKLKEWSKVIANLKQRELRDTLIGLYPAAAGEKGEFLRRECYAKYRNKMGPEPRIALPTAAQLEQTAASSDPLFAIGAYCASGNLKYPEAMLKYVLSEKVDNKSMQNAARLCLAGLAMRDENVRKMLKKHLKTASGDVKEKFFEDFPKETTQKIISEP